MNEKDEEDKERYQRERIQHSINYISGMMDTFAIKEYEKYFSVPFDSISLKQIGRINKILVNDKLLLQTRYMTVKHNNNSIIQIMESKIELKQHKE